MATQRLRDTRRPTINDVAELAGVSRQTVSRVLSNHPRVAPATRARVEKVIGDLDYRPNRMARALVTKTSLTFGVASVDMRNLHFAETCSGLQAAAREGGYHLVVTELDPDDQRGVGTLETLLAIGVDGIVLFPSMVNSADDDVSNKGASSTTSGRVPTRGSAGIPQGRPLTRWVRTWARARSANSRALAGSIIAVHMPWMTMRGSGSNRSPT